MRPWIHIPLLVFLFSLVLASWVLMRRVPVERQGTAPVLAAEMENPFAASPLANAVLEGILVDSEGVPQALADISTLQDGRVLWTHTDLQGNFRLESLQAGPLEISVLADGHLPETLAVAGPGKDIHLALKSPPTPVPSLTEPERSDWRGRMRNPRNPREIEGFEVWLNPAGPPQEVASGIPRRALTDSDGRFEFKDLLHARYTMQLLPPDSVGGMGPDMLVPMGSESKILDHDGTPHTAELISLGGGLEGTVYSGPKLNRTPIPAAMVMVTGLGQDTSEGAADQVLPAVMTDRQGRWSVADLAPGRYRIQVRGGGIDTQAIVILEAHQTHTVVFPE